jgi:hypothetical protein
LSRSIVPILLSVSIETGLRFQLALPGDLEMLPANRSQAQFLCNLIVASVRKWIREEIVDDDPWDQEDLSFDETN